MNNKPKLNEIAKDLGISGQEIIDFFSEKNITKKATAVLDADEMTMLIETYSQKNQVDSFNDYFATAAQKKEVKKEVPVKTEKPAEIKKEEKSEIKPFQQNKPTEKPVQNNAQRPNQSVQNNAQRPNQHTQNNAQRPNQTVQQKPDFKKKPEIQSRPENKPQQQNQVQKFNQQANKTQQAARPQQKPPAPVQQKPQAPQNHGVKTQLKTNISDSSNNGANIRTIDTRGNYVELDKYNEKYTNMASEQGSRGKDNFAKKQKITQKSVQRNKQQYSNKKETETEKLRRLELERARKQQLKVLIPDEIIVSEFAIRLKVTASDVIKKLMLLGEMKGINDVLDFDTAALVAEEFGAKVEKEVIVTVEERLIDDSDDDDTNLIERSPVVVVMGHVDHGKTSLLDKIRNANVTEGEAGGITQHIGAYRVKAKGREITFLDTPGHAAFTSMRARGAQVTDIAILVVAADDGIMPQTVEAINHAKAAEVSIIIAINKMDKPDANPEKVKQELTEHGLLIEEWGGDVICVPVSAKTGEGIDDLLENILLVSDVRELKANPNRLAKGTVIEARLDKGRGPIATILVQNGTLHTGDVIIAGTAVGRVRVMTNDKGQTVTEAGPSVPVEITGLAEVPAAGDIFNAVEDEKLARELVEQRKHQAKEEEFKAYQKITLDNLFSQIAEGEMKELPIIVKADVQGSVEAVKQSLEKLSNEEVRVRVIHGGVGAVSENDVMLANASNAIIIGFNVRPDPIASQNAARDSVDMRFYRIIYDAIEEISTAMKGMLAPKFREVIMGRVEVRQVYKITNVGAVAGSYVLDGKVTRNCQIRVVRDGIVIAEDKMSSLKRFKDDMKEVAQGYECGITLDKFSDVREGDIFEAFIMEEYREA
ncbi:MAG TPA: translation initiation factor IF-2 [Oscillospiraceae bacterium]|nr:translation initiation factor IF-2 [Oscillospiraceae bacterium]